MDISNMQKCQEEYEKFLKESPFQNEIEKIARDICERQDNAMAMEFTRVICNLLEENGVFIHGTEYRSMEDVFQNTMKERYGVIFDSVDFSEHDKKFTDEIKKLKHELDRKETTINQIDDILNELFGVTHGVVDKLDEFKKILKEKIENGKTIADFLPEEPIEVATKLINATYTRNKGELEKKIDKVFGNTSDITVEQMYSVSELRQIAEHLLVYCNNQKENDNE